MRPKLKSLLLSKLSTQFHQSDVIEDFLKTENNTVLKMERFAKRSVLDLTFKDNFGDGSLLME